MIADQVLFLFGVIHIFLHVVLFFLHLFQFTLYQFVLCNVNPITERGADSADFPREPFIWCPLKTRQPGRKVGRQAGQAGRKAGLLVLGFMVSRNGPQLER